MPQTVVTLPLVTYALSQVRAGASCVASTSTARHVLHVAQVTALIFWLEVEIHTHSSGSNLFLM